MGYAVICTNNPCGSAVGRWYIGGGPVWLKNKPKANECVSINDAFKFKEKEDKFHSDCQCAFEVVEIGE